MLAAVTVGPLLVVGLATAVLAVLSVRHAFFIALLGVTASAAVVVTASALAAGRVEPGVPAFVAAGAIGYGLAGVAHARNLSPTVRCTALALVLVSPVAAQALTRLVS